MVNPDAGAIGLTHLGFIMDGNRRWAVGSSRPKLDGHAAGYDALIRVMTRCVELNIKYVTVYAFSTENWSRSKQEVDRIMQLMFRGIIDDLHIFTDKNVRLRFLGSREKLSRSLLAKMDEAEQTTAGFAKSTLSVCFNYGGQTEIVEACRAIVSSGVSPEMVDADLITKNIYHPDIPPLDMIVRTSGEHRLSNFMLWRSAYAEILFIDKFWPDMTVADVDEIVTRFSESERRFGH